MSVFRSLLLGKKPPRLPAGYQEVEYIEGTGTQYINTNLYLSSGLKFDIDYSISDATVYQTIIGSDNGWRSRYFFGAVDTTISKSYWYYGNRSITFDNEIGALNLKTNVQNNGNTLTMSNINGTVTKSVSASLNYTSDYTIMLFALNREGSIVDQSHAKIYMAKIYNGNNLIRDYVPCYRKSDGIIGLYDLVNNTFSTNSGSGTFIKGRDI